MPVENHSLLDNLKSRAVYGQIKSLHLTLPVNLLALLLFTITVSISLPAKSASANQAASTITDLTKWKDQLWREASSKGISQKTFIAAIKETQPDYQLPRVRTHKDWAALEAREKIRKSTPVKKGEHKGELPASCYRPRQKEFLFPTLYFPPKHISSLVQRGKILRKKYASTFKKIEQTYGVDIRAVLGIWGRETAFGAAKNKYDGVRTLMSLAFAGEKEKRNEHRANLLRALKFIDDGHITIEQFKTSFAGATGYPQFTPDVFETYAVDWDGDGRKNIWSSVPDAVASAARYLKGIGWQANQTWGYEVELPANFDCSQEGPKDRQPISEWIKIGVKRVPAPDGTPQKFSNPNLKAQFMAPAGMNGPKFLVLENFEVFRRYNKADLYALFVGHLGDNIYCDESDAKCDFKESWPSKDEFNFTRKRICAMQIHLQRVAASDETPDGLFGGKTRRGIGTYEKHIKQKPTCFPSNDLLKSLRQGETR